MVTSNKMTMNKSLNGGYGNTTAAGQDFFTGKFLERTISQTVYVLSNKNIYFFEKSFVYPFDQVIPNKKGFIITNDKLCKVLAYVEKTGMSHI